MFKIIIRIVRVFNDLDRRQFQNAVLHLSCCGKKLSVSHILRINFQAVGAGISQPVVAFQLDAPGKTQMAIICQDQVDMALDLYPPVNGDICFRLIPAVLPYSVLRCYKADTIFDEPAALAVIVISGDDGFCRRGCNGQQAQTKGQGQNDA